MTSAIALFGAFQDYEIRWNGDLDKPEWVAQDIADALGIKNVRQNLAEFDSDEKGVYSAYTLKGEQELLTVTEPGLYRLVFKSRKPEAKVFRRWVFHEVLPSIRKTGGYGNATPQNPFNHPEVKELLDAVKDKEMNLSALEIRLLTFLRETSAAGRDGITLEEAVAATGIHKATFYRVVKRFQAFGLIEPQPPVTRYRFRNLRAVGMLEAEED
jgi:prophage antirepressor-like protein